MKIIIINGPNLNLLGTREKSIYGNESFEAYNEKLRVKFPSVEIEYYQSNVEGELINKLHEVGFSYDGIVLNAGGYTHTSVAISDAIAAIKTHVVEVHISNIHAREEFRHSSLITKECVGMITGFGLSGYDLALTYLEGLK
ncbi:MAG: type II 3-dehydroquinate dehydratase [Cytophagales bacterium CG12_big_fil_rev_8_21_14_0_65_40_12]|nr:MAG: type II 3-dehydroquinate dehydratase [Cytophagales bacterium CG12_big_fil_rev_8_21_14_0_65_40_12]PIW03853.1 MAG: type II 3-dehydroquinate dehydratase [Cytophagales bacterium CG17_big_fil_post_rev_8_21_14_2_50_40_13]